MSGRRLDHSVFDADLTGRAFDRRVMRRTLRYLRPYRHWLLASSALVLVASMTAVWMPVVMTRVIIDGVLYPSPGVTAPDFGMRAAHAWLERSVGLAPLAAACLLYGLLVLAWAAMGHVQRLLLARACLAGINDLRRAVFVHLEGLAPAFFDHVAAGRLMTRVTNDVEVLLELFWGLGMLVGEIVPFFLALVLMFAADASLAALMLGAIPLVAVATWIFRRATQVVYRNVRQSVSRMNQNLQENLSGMRVVQTHCRELYNLDRYRAINRGNRHEEIRAIDLEVSYGGFIDSLTGLALALILWFGGTQALHAAITLGTVILFARYADMLFRPIVALGEQYNVLYRAMASTERIFQLLDWDERIGEPAKAAALPTRLAGRVEFREVSFAYGDGPRVVDGVSLAIEPGERVAIVGTTGAGKTTLVRLLSRFYDLEEGAILVDGIDVREVSAPALRRRLGIVLQDFHVFTGNVRENLRLGDATISDAEVERAARLVQAHEFICALPQGYDTALAERGANLSHGQRQLLAFARVLVADPEVLILDEATASIDPHTERLIQQALHRITAGRTSILIAHRLLTVREADRIVVMHHGRVREVGTHDQLIARGGLYRTLHELQFRDGKDAA